MLKVSLLLNIQKSYTKNLEKVYVKVGMKRVFPKLCLKACRVAIIIDVRLGNSSRRHNKESTYNGGFNFLRKEKDSLFVSNVIFCAVRGKTFFNYCDFFLFFFLLFCVL